MHRGLIVADDLTGACDTGHEFAKRGYSLRVVVDDAASDDRDAAVDVLVVNTDSRYDSPAAAATAVRTAVESRPGGVVYKKIDSTLRGNLGTEVSAALSAISNRARAATDGGEGEPLAVVAPASPATGRTTACGHHLVDGALVTDTEVARDSANGPSSSRLSALFEDADYPVDHVGLRTVAEGAAAVAERFGRHPDGPRIVTLDATHDRHLAAVTAAARGLDRPVVYVGSAGLAGHVEVPNAPAGGGTADRDATDRVSRSADSAGVLGVVGSVAPASLRGLDALPDGVVIDVDSVAAIEAPDAAAASALERTRSVIDADGRAVVTAATDRTAVDRALAAGDEAGLSARETRERIADVLARTAAGVFADRPPKGLFLTGGDTAMAVLDALDARAIDLRGEAVQPGIPLGTVEGGAADGTALVTRAGAFGDSETISSCLDHLRTV